MEHTMNGQDKDHRMKTLTTDPELMTPQERQREIGTLLALGFLRMRLRHVHSRAGCASPAEKELDFAGQQSVHRVEPEKGDRAWSTR